MADIKAADVAKLRKVTGAGMMDCKAALKETEGDFDKAIEVIRKKGQAVAYNIKPHLRCINEKNKTLKLTGK